jgi:hypothetical protein
MAGEGIGILANSSDSVADRLLTGSGGAIAGLIGYTFAVVMRDSYHKSAHYDLIGPFAQKAYKKIANRDQYEQDGAETFVEEPIISLVPVEEEEPEPLAA